MIRRLQKGVGHGGRVVFHLVDVPEEKPAKHPGQLALPFPHHEPEPPRWRGVAPINGWAMPLDLNSTYVVQAAGGLPAAPPVVWTVSARSRGTYLLMAAIERLWQRGGWALVWAEYPRDTVVRCRCSADGTIRADPNIIRINRECGTMLEPHPVAICDDCEESITFL